jgi:hypothetical protein
MNPPKYTAIEYINFLMATQKAYSCTEAERVQPTTASAAAHDAINRLLHRLEPEPEELWQEAKDSVGKVMDSSKYSRLLPQTVTLTTGRPMIYR